ASYYRVTGAETFILSDEDVIKLKEILIDIEDNHPLGRLFDFDVIDKDFTFISRTAVGYEKRKCLLCDEDAAICVRSRSHSYEQLIKEVYFLTYSYFDNIKSFSNERGGF
ncbi:MAG: citrate lyase holo-[acyl-carrier protein] synthase, partial [Clostridia bacterium]|nr:citrate lyase holo-[acyl-carrier protein] synthase [Clostridia bacterium]